MSELKNTVMMYEPDDLKREFGLLEDILQTFARERVDTPLQQDCAICCCRTSFFDSPLPKGSDVVQRVIAEADGLVDTAGAIIWQHRRQTPDGLWSRWYDDPRTGQNAAATRLCTARSFDPA